jgi:hypothetical protein
MIPPEMLSERERESMLVLALICRGQEVHLRGLKNKSKTPIMHVENTNCSLRPSQGSW